VVEVRLTDFRCEADYCEVRTQQGLRDVSSEVAVGAGYKRYISTHE